MEKRSVASFPTVFGDNQRRDRAPAGSRPAGPSRRERMPHNAVTMLVKLGRQLLVLWISLWLPLAGSLAAAMPLAGQTGQEAALSPESAEMHSPAMTADSHDPPSCHADADKAACDHCELCHIATSLMPATAPQLAGAEAAREGLRAGRVVFQSHFPETPQRPPLAHRAHQA